MMSSKSEFTTKNIAQAAIFTSLYVVFGFLKISPIIGLPGQAITAAAIVAPLIGIILGPYLGMLSAFLGGTVGFFFGSFSPLSLTSGVATATCSGLIHNGKRIPALLVYLALFLLLALYPSIGPVWLFPTYVWFQAIGLLVLLSPLLTVATQKFHTSNDSSVFYAYFVTALVSTLAGQIAGTLTLELIQVPDANYFLGTWVTTAFVYPIERTVIALGATLIGVALHKALASSNLKYHLNQESRKQKLP